MPTAHKVFSTPHRSGVIHGLMTAGEKKQHLQQTANFLPHYRNLFLSVVSVVKHSVILLFPDVLVVCDRGVPSAARCVKLTAVNCDAIC